MRYLFLMLACSLIAVGCETTDSERIDYQLPELNLPYSEPYSLDMSEIIEPDEPNFMFMIEDGEGGLRLVIDDETPTHVVLIQDDMNKIDAMLTVKSAYKQIAKHEESLINIEREKGNALKEMLMIERQSRIMERNLRLDVEYAYKKERRDHKFDNVMNRVTWVMAIVGGIVICAL